MKLKYVAQTFNIIGTGQSGQNDFVFEVSINYFCRVIVSLTE